MAGGGGGLLLDPASSFVTSGRDHRGDNTEGGGGGAIPCRDPSQRGRSRRSAASSSSRRRLLASSASAESDDDDDDWSFVLLNRDEDNPGNEFYDKYGGRVRECDYDGNAGDDDDGEGGGIPRRGHALYRALEDRDWERAASLFEVGRSSPSSVKNGGRGGGNDKDKDDDDDDDGAIDRGREMESRGAVLTRTWVRRHVHCNPGLVVGGGGGGSVASDGSAAAAGRKKRRTKTKWRITPLHAAAIFGAPPSIYRLMIATNPGVSSLRDDRGNLPLHLAFRNGAEEACVNALLTDYVQGMEVRNDVGLTPLMCVSYGPSDSAIRHKKSPLLRYVHGNLIESAKAAEFERRLAAAEERMKKEREEAVQTVFDLLV